jgi:uncharacterized protein (DUF2147 family)
MKYIAFIMTMMFCYGQVNAQTNADKIVGKWLKLPKEDLIIEVYKSGEVYNGKIDWVKEGDSSKPNGFLILENLQYDESKDSWEGGKIHDPRSGNQYKAAVELKDNGTLEVLGYKGFKFIGSKKTFRKVK